MKSQGKNPWSGTTIHFNNLKLVETANCDVVEHYGKLSTVKTKPILTLFFLLLPRVTAHQGLFNNPPPYSLSSVSLLYFSTPIFLKRPPARSYFWYPVIIGVNSIPRYLNSYTTSNCLAKNWLLIVGCSLVGDSSDILACTRGFIFIYFEPSTTRSLNEFFKNFWHCW